MPRPIGAAAAALALLVVLAGCSLSTLGPNAIQGQGAVTSEARATQPFRRIKVGEGFHLDARTGDAASVSVAAQANLLPLISTTVTDGELVVSLTSAQIVSAQPMTVTVVAPQLDGLRLDTGAAGTLDVTTPSLELDVTGGASVVGQGSVRALDLHTDLGGSAELSGVNVGDATVSIGVGGTATVGADTSLAGVVETGGRLVLADRPPTLRVDVRLGGSMIDG